MIETKSDFQNFLQYAKFYDLFNKDKPYAEEAAYVSLLLLHDCPWVQDILELGSGTGKHGKALADLGFNVYGVERSRDMVELAEQSRDFRCQVGDIQSVRLGQKFDAAVALFHVMSYQKTDTQFDAVLNTVDYHLNAGGLFFFDVWHGPAVLSKGPEIRKRWITVDGKRIIRKAVPELVEQDRIVVVNYSFSTPELEFSEQHIMRYFFPDEIIAATAKRFKCLSIKEMLTGNVVSSDTWSAGYLLQKL